MFDRSPNLHLVADKGAAVVVHLGTMLMGHYIAYCLVDPEKMFEPRTDSSDRSEADATVNGAAEKLAGLHTADGAAKKDRRVWCYCSE